MTERYLSLKEVAAIFSVSPDTIARWVAAGKFPGAIKVGTITRVPTSAIEKFKDSNVAYR